ncbi:hypothetical protein BCEN4_40066 [Burkholderia cenocepacia]|nr:hypothetical protein BCEN4_40066 [Burkholderia cenocepacia]
MRELRAVLRHAPHRGSRTTVPLSRLRRARRPCRQRTLARADGRGTPRRTRDQRACRARAASVRRRAATASSRRLQLLLGRRGEARRYGVGRPQAAGGTAVDDQPLRCAAREPMPGSSGRRVWRQRVGVRGGKRHATG